MPLGLVFKASEAENPARPCHQWPGLGLHWQALGATRQTQLTLISPIPQHGDVSLGLMLTMLACSSSQRTGN